jgi:hypothetical protein
VAVHTVWPATASVVDGPPGRSAMSVLIGSWISPDIVASTAPGDQGAKAINLVPLSGASTLCAASASISSLMASTITRVFGLDFIRRF